MPVIWIFRLISQLPPSVWFFLALLLGGGTWIGVLKVELAVCHRQVEKAKKDSEIAHATIHELEISNKDLQAAIASQNRAVEELQARAARSRENAAKAVQEAQKARISEGAILAKLKAYMSNPPKVESCPGDAGLEVVRQGLL